MSTKRPASEMGGINGNGPPSSQRSRTDAADSGSAAQGFDAASAVAAAQARAAAIAASFTTKSSTAASTSSVSEAQQRAAALEVQIAAKLSALSAPSVQHSLSAAANAKKRAEQVRMDEKGNLLDAAGNVLSMSAPPRSFQFSSAADSSAPAPPAPKPAAPAPKQQPEELPEMVVRRRRRGRRGLNFDDAPGRYIAAAAAQREADAAAAAAAAAREAAGPGFGFGSSMRPVVHADVPAAPSSAPHYGSGIASALPLRPELAAVPDIEWWDAGLLPGKLRKERAAAVAAAAAGKGPPPHHSFEQLATVHAKTHAYVEHPVPVSGQADGAAPRAMKLMLTQRERKRLRRQRRSERFQDERDLIEAGLAPKPEPKVKVSNMMRVLGESVMDPSAIERKVRAAMASREANHNARNAARKLTPAERKAKHQAKMTEDVAGTGGVHAAVFVVRDLSDRRQRYKVDINARQLHLRGVVLLCAPEELNMVLVEGGLRAIGKYKKLLMRRMDWNRVITEEEEAASAAARAAAAAERAGDDADAAQWAEEEEEEGDSDEELAGPSAAKAGHNQCAFVWEGVESRPRFAQFRFEECYTADGARRLLARFGCAAYWDTAKAAAPWRQSGAQLALPPAALADETVPSAAGTTAAASI